MKNIYLFFFLFLFIGSCSLSRLRVYDYKKTSHSPSVLFDKSKLTEYPATWNFYVHDGYGRAHKVDSISLDSSSINTILETRAPIELPEKLEPKDYTRKQEVHVFVNDLNLVPDKRLEFKESDMREVLMYSNPRIEPEKNKEESKSVAAMVLTILGIVLASIGVAALLIWLAIESFLNSIGCYIATMAYGSYNAPEVIVLRRFRDEKLKKTFFGRVFIANYYALSPLLVKFVKKTGIAEKFIRRRLDRLVSRLQSKHNW